MWQATGWTRRAHQVVDGRAACGYAGAVPGQWHVSILPRCQRCQYRLDDTPAPPWRTIRRPRTSLARLTAGLVYAGPDPLIHAIHRYEQEGQP